MNAALNDNPEATAEERIAQVLLAKGRLKEADHGRALRLQTESGGALSGLLVRLGMVSERDMAEASSEVFGLPLVYSKDCPESPPENLALTVRFMKQPAVCTIFEKDDVIELLLGVAIILQP